MADHRKSSQNFAVRLFKRVFGKTGRNSASDTMSSSDEEETAESRISSDTQTFAAKLFKELSKKSPGNLFVSPLSLQIVLALAHIGAKGETAREIAALLSLSEDMDDTYLGYRTLIKVLQDPSLKLVNKMFVEATAKVKEEFQKNAEQHFQAPSESVNFKSDPEQSRQHINTWVEDNTNNKIKDLLAQGVVDEATRMVLVNAVYFKANWDYKKDFKEEKTTEKPFYVNKTQTVPVQMMNNKSDYFLDYNRELKAKILALDYEGGDFRMLVILPDEIDGLAALESKLNAENLRKCLGVHFSTTVTVSLPKFKLEETMDLKDILKKLGVQSMFNPGKADFSGVSDEPLCVSSVTQKAFVEVNEKGTEAAASTCSRMMFMCARPDDEFIADHPFLFIISHYRSNP